MSNSRHRRDSRARTKVLHIITDLDIGGTERMLVALMSTLAEAVRLDGLSLMRCGTLAVESAPEGIDQFDFAPPRSGFRAFTGGLAAPQKPAQASEP